MSNNVRYTKMYALNTGVGVRYIRRRIGKRRTKPNFVGLAVMTGSLLGNLYLMKLGDPTIKMLDFYLSAEEPSAVAEQVGESERAVISTDDAGQRTLSPAYTKQELFRIVVEVFGDKADEAIQIMKCESGYRPDNVGDTTLMSQNQQTGEVIGDSIGLFQIRTGSSNWNRALQNGMTADEFREAMKDPNQNIRMAKKLYDAQGWRPWLNCKNKLGL